MKQPVNRVVIDIGSSRVRVLIAQLPNIYEPLKFTATPPKMTVVSVGIISKSVLKNGVVSTITAASDAIRSAVSMAEKNSGLKIHSALICISGEHILSGNYIGKAEIDGRYINKNDIFHVVSDIKQQVADKNLTVLHVIQQQFIVDEFDHIDDPIGMKADHLRLRAHVIGMNNSALDNLQRSVNDAGIEVENIIYSGLASSYLATTKDQRDNGVLAIDLGADTTDIVLWNQGCPQWSMTIAMGGEMVSSDIASIFRTPRTNAEILKCHYGSVLQSLQKSPQINIPSTGYLPDRPVSSADFVATIRARYQEIFDIIQQRLQKAGFRHLPNSGIVFTGGASQIQGLSDFASNIFRTPVHIFIPEEISGMPDLFQCDVMMTTALGMLNLTQYPLPDHVWIKEEKNSIINRFTYWVKRNLLTEEE